MLHDVNAKDFPVTFDNGKSEVVHVFTTDGKEMTAKYRRDGWWQDIDGETFGNVRWWVNTEFPYGFNPDPTLYGGDDEYVPEVIRGCANG